jgi:hypothetical protein
MVIFWVISLIINFLAVFKQEKYTKVLPCLLAAIVLSCIIFPVFFNLFNLIKS